MRLRPMQIAMLKDDAKASGFRSESEYVVDRLGLGGAKEAQGARSGAAPASGQQTLARPGESTADRVALAKGALERLDASKGGKVLSGSLPASGAIDQHYRPALVERCEHGLVFENCEVCTELKRG